MILGHAVLLMKTVESMRYREIARQLQEQVRRGELKPGERLPSFVQMRAQGISQHTMEKAYALLESEGLIDRANGSGVYVTDGALRQKAATGLIGFLGGPNARPQQFGMHFYGVHLQQGAREAAREHGLHLMLLDVDSDAEVWRKLDGVLSVDRDIAVSVPRVQLMTAGDGDSVVADDETGIAAAIEHLVLLGHRSIAYLLAPQEPYHSQRLNAYRAALHAYDIRPDTRWVRHIHRVWEHPTSFVGAAAERMGEWLREDWTELGCTALLCQNDQAAIGAIESLRKAGLRIPEDVSVVGFDGTEASDYARPRLTTIEVPLHEIGRVGMEVLIEQIGGGSQTHQRALPTRLKVGASTAAVPLAAQLRSGAIK